MSIQSDEQQLVEATRLLDEQLETMTSQELLFVQSRIMKIQIGRIDELTKRFSE